MYEKKTFNSIAGKRHNEHCISVGIWTLDFTTSKIMFGQKYFLLRLSPKMFGIE